MKEYAFTELGYFTKSTAEVIGYLCNNKFTYMNLEVGFSNMHGNYTLIIKTDYDAREEEIKGLFLNYYISVTSMLIKDDPYIKLVRDRILNKSNKED